MKENSVENKKILIIDSDPLLGELVHYIFSSRVDVVRISSFAEFLSCDVEEYSMVILDPTIDQGSGREIVDMLRGSTDNKIPIVITATPNYQKEVVNCLNAGATDFISRPFEVNLLTARITKLLKL